MQGDWMRFGIDFGLGAAGGVVDQIVQNVDEKREADAHAKTAVMKQIGTYVNYGLPLLNVVGVATGFLKGDWATRTTVMTAQLAGRKATWQISKRNRVVTYGVWTREDAALQKAAQEAMKGQPGSEGLLESGALYDT
jgi:hypothetical protein